MEFYKNGRFYIGVILLLIVGAALLLGKVTWDQFSAGVIGFLVRFGGDKFITMAEAKKAGTTLAVLLCIVATGCMMTPQQQKWFEFGADVLVTVGEPQAKLGCSKVVDPNLKQLCFDGIKAAKKAKELATKNTACPVCKTCPATSGTAASVSAESGTMKPAPLVDKSAPVENSP